MTQGIIEELQRITATLERIAVAIEAHLPGPINPTWLPSPPYISGGMGQGAAVVGAAFPFPFPADITADNPADNQMYRMENF
jgi:hypothetical protein